MDADDIELFWAWRERGRPFQTLAEDLAFWLAYVPASPEREAFRLQVMARQEEDVKLGGVAPRPAPPPVASKRPRRGLIAYD